MQVLISPAIDSEVSAGALERPHPGRHQPHRATNSPPEALTGPRRGVSSLPGSEIRHYPMAGYLRNSPAPVRSSRLQVFERGPHAISARPCTPLPRRHRSHPELDPSFTTSRRGRLRHHGMTENSPCPSAMRPRLNVKVLPSATVTAPSELKMPEHVVLQSPRVPPAAW